MESAERKHTVTRRALPPLIELTRGAADRLGRLYGSERSGRTLRIGVRAKGCAGMSYDLAWVEQPCADDERVTQYGVAVLVDRAAALFVAGTVMDWVEGPLSSGFVFRNPKATTCGCGESFGV